MLAGHEELVPYQFYTFLDALHYNLVSENRKRYSVQEAQIVDHQRVKDG